jgi:lipid-A-disaccharide synthase
MSAPHLFVIAGEPSGDRLGADLMRGLKVLAPDVTFTGIGGAQMEAEGLKSLFPMSELAVMGIAEILPRLPNLLRRIRETTAAVTATAPDALISIDSPDFCLRVAAKAKAARPGLRTIHYVAPTVWAWRPERAGKMARHIDHVLALFPFEPPFMEAAGMTCDFVGHPVVADPKADEEAVADLKAEFGFNPYSGILTVLPGSRAGEVRRMAPVFGEVVARVLAARPNTCVIVPAASNVADQVAAEVARWPGQTVLLDPRGRSAQDVEIRKRAAFAASDLALAASGSVSLELAAAGLPMVVAYRFNWLTTRIVKRKVRLKWATLVNILTDSPAVPEFLFEACDAGRIAPEVLRLLGDPEARSAQIAAERAALDMLGAGGENPGLRAARSVLAAISR